MGNKITTCRIQCDLTKGEILTESSPLAAPVVVAPTFSFSSSLLSLWWRKHWRNSRVVVMVVVVHDVGVAYFWSGLVGGES